MCSRMLIIVFILFLLLPSGKAFRRRHRGPTSGKKEKVLRGRTLTSIDSTDSSTSEISTNAPHSVRLATSPGARVVDFALHLRRDVVLWDEVQTDDVSLSDCSISNDGKAMFLLSGSQLDLSDYNSGTIFIIDETDFENCSNRPTPSMPHIDSADTQLFLDIKSSHRTRDQKLRVVSIVTPGQLVVPTVDIYVHENPEPNVAAEMKSKVEYEDEPHSDWKKMEHTMPATSHMIGNVTGLSLPTMSRLTLQNKVISIGEESTLELSLDAHVRIKHFRLIRRRSLEFRWEQELSVSVSAKLEVAATLLAYERRGPIAKVFVPSLSFSVRVPVAGSLRVGGFIGLNWVRELRVTRTASVSIEAEYKKRQVVRASVRKLQFRAYDAGSSANGTAHIEVSRSNSYRLSLYGFYGVRPVLGMGVTYERRKLRRQGLKISLSKERKSINGNVGADLGSELWIGFKSPPFKAYSGPGITLGDCKSCHSLQGRLSLRGKNLSFQSVKNGDVERNIVMVNNLFNVPVGTVCAIKQACVVY